MKPLTLIIEHTLLTLDGLPTARRVQLLEALREISTTKHEQDVLTAQIQSLRDAEKHHAQLLLDLRARRAA